MSEHDERERLFQLFHDLVDEALVQYADGFAVDLEHRYYELADTLIAERAALEQQLAQAQNDAEHYAEIAQGDESKLCELQEKYEVAQAEQATMRVLLERLTDYSGGFRCAFCEGFKNQHHPQCRVTQALAFLAAHPKQD